MCDDKVKETTLVSLILKFTKDNNKWVRTASLLQLGPFIHCLAGCQISEMLLENYCQMVNENDFDVIFFFTSGIKIVKVSNGMLF